ncbi:MAG: flagellar basal body P-ring protein FlgI [Rhizobiaceae bacterium]|jgi:flagellar P-ring protein precursor FlgI|nr:flagellar basal body P-ring protein FlgI [Rhizobiaceae bacterium]
MFRRLLVAISLVAVSLAQPVTAADYGGGRGASRDDGGYADDGAYYGGYDKRGGPALPDRGGLVSRIKDIASLQSTRDNQLVGYGLVIGLQGTGDSLRNSPFTEQSIRAMLQNLGIASEGGRARAKNVAAVIVTANFPAFMSTGARMDVTVSSMGDATSLAGGTLIMTPLKAADGEIYAVAQGPVIVTGFNAQGAAEKLTQGVPTAGRVPNGALVEREIDEKFAHLNQLKLEVRNADFRTAVKIADSINAFTRKEFGKALAFEQDSRTVIIEQPAKISTARFYAMIEDLPVEIDMPARVIVDERTGTIVIGQNVKISRVAISHGTLTVRITEMPRVVQPDPFSKGETAVEDYTVIDAARPDATVATLDGPDLETLVAGLNKLGVKPDGIIAILQAIKSSGALQADLVLQ